MPATFTTVHPLSHSQRERRQRLLDAARDLAAQGGYPAVTMHAVADRAGLARATVYRYFGSKDQLLTAVGAEWARGVIAAQRAVAPESGTAADRVGALLDALFDQAATELPLCSAVVSAIISGDPTADRERQELYALWMSRFDEILDTAVPAADRAEIDYLLGQILLGAFTSMCMLGQTPDRIRTMLAAAARRLLP